MTAVDIFEQYKTGCLINESHSGLDSVLNMYQLMMIILHLGLPNCSNLRVLQLEKN